MGNPVPAVNGRPTPLRGKPRERAAPDSSKEPAVIVDTADLLSYRVRWPISLRELVRTFEQRPATLAWWLPLPQ